MPSNRPNLRENEPLVGGRPGHRRSVDILTCRVSSLRRHFRNQTIGTHATPMPRRRKILPKSPKSSTTTKVIEKYSVISRQRSRHAYRQSRTVRRNEIYFV